MRQGKEQLHLELALTQAETSLSQKGESLHRCCHIKLQHLEKIVQQDKNIHSPLVNSRYSYKHYSNMSIEVEGMNIGSTQDREQVQSH